MKTVKRLLVALLFLLLVLTGLVIFVVGTESGLQFAGQRLQSQFGEAVQMGRLSGRLASAIDVEDLRVQVGSDVYSIGHVHLDWSPQALLRSELRVNRLTAESVTVALAPATATEDTGFSIAIDLPVDITLTAANIESLTIEGVGDAPMVFEQLSLSARAVNQQLQIDTLQLTTADYQAGLAGSL
ncbi:MAG: hypothetical protein WBP44_01415, partial [Gammaproteobacteria bacterium]